MINRLFALFLTLCLLLPAFSLAESTDTSALSLYEAPFILPVEQVYEVPEGYTGIYSAADLQKIKDNSEGKYILMDNIIMNGISLRAIGFKGELEGNGYTISNFDLDIALNPRDTYYVGFFGWVRDASIRNLRLEGKITILDNGFKTECNAYVGGLAGRVYGSSTISNCVVNVDITYENAMKNYLAGYYGGVTGLLSCEKGASVSYCRNMGVVFGPEHVGGIVGYLEATQKGSPVKPAIHACYNNGVVDALGRSAGGIVGESANNTSPGNKSILISSCANHGEVFALYSAGGILGRANTRDVVGYTCIEDCINLGTIATRDAPVSPTAGIVGYGDCYTTRCVNYSKVLGNPDSGINTNVSEASFLKDNYYLDTVDYACLPTDRHLEITEGKLTAEEMKLKESFPALDFENIWDLNEGMAYPYPKPLMRDDAFSPIWPLDSAHMRITTLSYYWNGGKNPYGHSCWGGKYHIGFDVSAKKLPVYAVEDGEVIKSEYSTTSGYGNFIMIRHTVKDADNVERYIFSLYAHLENRKNAEDTEVKVGDIVKKGDLIGSSGNTSAKYPNMSYHLHFELFEGTKSGSVIDGNIWMAYRHLDLIYDDTCYLANNHFKGKDAASQTVIDYIDAHYKKEGSVYTRVSHADDYTSFISNLTKVSVK